MIVNERQMVLPFGPPVLVARLSDRLIRDFNRSIDKTARDPEASKAQDWSENLVGKVEQEFVIEQGVFEAHATELGKHVEAYIMHARAREAEFALSDLSPEVRRKTLNQQFSLHVLSWWAVRSLAGDYNPVHIHTGCDISCIGYLKLPDWDEELAEDNEDHHPSHGQLEFIAGRPQSFGSHRWKITPRIGDFYVFPAWLMHTAYPFLKSTGERRSFSANWKIHDSQTEQQLKMNASPDDQSS